MILPPPLMAEKAAVNTFNKALAWHKARLTDNPSHETLLTRVGEALASGSKMGEAPIDRVTAVVAWAAQGHRRTEDLDTDTCTVKAIYHRIALREFNKLKWGSSIKEAKSNLLQTEGRLRPPTYLRLPFAEARKVADFRFDTFSPWRTAQRRRVKKGPADPSPCPLCEEKEARASHIIWQCQHPKLANLRKEWHAKWADTKVLPARLNFCRIVNFHYGGVTKEAKPVFERACMELISLIHKVWKETVT